MYKVWYISVSKMFEIPVSKESIKKNNHSEYFEIIYDSALTNMLRIAGNSADDNKYPPGDEDVKILMESKGLEFLISSDCRVFINGKCKSVDPRTLVYFIKNFEYYAERKSKTEDCVIKNGKDAIFLAKSYIELILKVKPNVLKWTYEKDGSIWKVIGNKGSKTEISLSGKNGRLIEILYDDKVRFP
jgi:hypothetical protein